MNDAAKVQLKKELMQRLGMSTKEEAISKTINDMTDKQKVNFLTNLMPREDQSFATLLNIATEYDLEWLDDTVVNWLILRCSVGGWRANQMENIAGETRKEASHQNLLQRLLHRGNGEKKETE